MLFVEDIDVSHSGCIINVESGPANGLKVQSDRIQEHLTRSLVMTSAKGIPDDDM